MAKRIKNQPSTIGRGLRIVPEPPGPPCGVFLDLCGFGLWRPKPGGCFELLGEADHALVKAEVESRLGLHTTQSNSQSSQLDGLLTFAEAARRVGLARKTLYEWKRTGKLRREHGLRVLGRFPRLDWRIFKDCIEKRKS